VTTASPRYPPLSDSRSVSKPRLRENGEELARLLVPGPYPLSCRFVVPANESQDGGAGSLSYDAGCGGVLPKRGDVYGADFVVPLYVGSPN